MQKFSDRVKAMSRLQLLGAAVGLVGLAYGVYEAVGRAAPQAVAAISGPASLTPEAVAAKPTGEQVSTTFKIAGAYTTADMDVTFINSKHYSKNHPDPTNLTVVVDKAAVPGFDDARKLKGKTVVVTGPVEEYEGKKEIKVSDPKQITLK